MELLCKLWNTADTLSRLPGSSDNETGIPPAGGMSDLWGLGACHGLGPI